MSVHWRRRVAKNRSVGEGVRISTPWVARPTHAMVNEWCDRSRRARQATARRADIEHDRATQTDFKCLASVSLDQLGESPSTARSVLCDRVECGSECGTGLQFVFGAPPHFTAMRVVSHREILMMSVGRPSRAVGAAGRPGSWVWFAGLSPFV
jgi:hypothetical protein